MSFERKASGVATGVSGEYPQELPKQPSEVRERFPSMTQHDEQMAKWYWEFRGVLRRQIDDFETRMKLLEANRKALLDHNTSHENEGDDEISVAGLSGLLEDPQAALPHDIISLHTGFPGGTSEFLRGDGRFAAPPSSPTAALTPPGGADTEVQYNDGGVFGGDANFTFAKAVKSLYVGSLATILPGVITRVGDYISTVALTGGRTLTIARVGNYISTITDGTKTWTFTRTNNLVSSWAVA